MRWCYLKHPEWWQRSSGSSQFALAMGSPFSITLSRMTHFILFLVSSHPPLVSVILSAIPTLRSRQATCYDAAFLSRVRRPLIFVFYVIQSTVPAVLVPLSQSYYVEGNYPTSLFFFKAGMIFWAFFVIVFGCILSFFFNEFRQAANLRLKTFANETTSQDSEAAEKGKKEISLLKFTIGKVSFFCWTSSNYPP